MNLSFIGISTFAIDKAVLKAMHVACQFLSRGVEVRKRLYFQYVEISLAVRTAVMRAVSVAQFSQSGGFRPGLLNGFLRQLIKNRSPALSGLLKLVTGER
jgi:hypothetical protein